MKSLYFPVLLALYALGTAASSMDPEAVKKIHESCFKMSHMPQEALAKIRAGEVDLSDTSVKNHIFCYTKSVGFVNDAGILNDNLIKEKLSLQVKDKEKVERDAKVCNAPKTADEEVNYFAAKVVACFYKTNPGLFIM